MAPKSLSLLVFTTSNFSPSFSVMSSEGSGIMPKMPMLPVRVVGSANTFLAPQLM